MSSSGGGLIVIVIAIFTAITRPVEAAILDPMTVMKDDISRIKVMMENVGEQMERFNSLYLSKLETRLMTSATSLAHIDSNVKNLQERAYVWDTFQLHVSAWNEQIKSLDKKLDILNRGAEKWELLDEKVGSLLPLDYKLTKLMTKLEETDTRVVEMQKKINSCSLVGGGGGGSAPGLSSTVSGTTGSETPLFSEYTSRGVLSALKDIEMKVNRIAASSAGASGAAGSNSGGSGSASNGRGVNKAEDLQQKTLDVVNDVAGKVDFILDKMVVKRHSGGGGGSRHMADDASSSIAAVDDSSAYEDDDDYSSSSGGERNFVKLWRRMLQPVRRANRKFESLDKVLAQLERAANVSLQQHRRDEGHCKSARDDVSSVLDCCRNGDTVQRALIKAVETLNTNIRTGMMASNSASTSSSCVVDSDLQLRLQQTQSFVVRQLSDVVKDQIRQSCLSSSTPSVNLAGVQHRNGNKSHQSPSIHLSANGTGIISFGENGENEQVTEGTVTQGQATPVDASNTPNSSTTTSTSTVPSTTAKTSGLLGCHDLRASGETEARIYSLASGKELNEGSRDYNTRFCDQTTDGGGWTVIQRRGDFGFPRENFSVGWKEYKLGFGQLDREFWFGNDFIHRLTNEHDVVLRVELWDFDGQSVYADYESFRVDSEEDLYRLWVEGYQGNATDSLGSHNGYAFSTFDRDNDEAPPCCPCAPAYGGGWWFYSCFEANLNGEYHANPTENDYFRGIIWELWRGDYSLRKAEMKIRPHDFVPPPTPTPTTTTTTSSTTTQSSVAIQITPTRPLYSDISDSNVFNSQDDDLFIPEDP